MKNDPKNTLKAEGLNVQDSCNITILENTEHDKYLVLPKVNLKTKKSLKDVSGGTVASSV